MIILIILIIVLLLSLSYINNLFKNDKVLLEDVKLQEKDQNEGFALMLEQSDGTYEESTSNSWPTNMVFNSELSGCIDSYGNKIENSLIYDRENNVVNVSVGETAYCYVYFDLDTIMPVINDVVKTSNEKTYITINVDASDESTGIDTYYYQIDNNSVVNNKTGTYTFNNLYAGTSYTIKVYVKDKAGLQSIVYSGIFTTELCKGNETLSSCLVNGESNIKDLWNSTLDGDGYRYIGANPNNYICFGTTDKETCTSDTDKYMYRIIGVFADSSGNQHVKLLKKEALNTKYSWHSSNSAVNWNNSDLYNGLNGSYFLTNTSYQYMQNSTWTNKITTWNYTMTNTLTSTKAGPNYYHITAEEIYLHELNSSSKASSIGTWENLNTKVSLMYVNDYMLALGNNALNYVGSSNSNMLKTSWMNLNKNDSDKTNENEWTMTRYDKSPNRAWTIISSGYSNCYYILDSYYVRPVFYLNSNIVVSNDSGIGSINDPIVIK